MQNTTNNNNTQIKNDLQAFLKIKPLTIPISNPYLSIAPTKTYVTYTSIKKTTKEKIPRPNTGNNIPILRKKTTGG